jgi:EmrB/QacA subfamily drug resistance transporter
VTADPVVPAAPGRVAPGALVVFLGVQIAQVMSSLDGTIVATALPEITDDVGGFSRVTWVVTAYTLAGVASMPIYGKLGDLYGRKKMLLGAIALFLTASAACGAAQSMDQLLVARFCQGLGGGGLGTLSMAAIADIVPARQLGRWLGYQGFVYAVASVAGPLVGGLFVDHLSWRWAFYVNLPVGLVAAGIIAVGMKLPYRRVAHSIDWLGSATLTTSLALVVLIATLGGHDVRWASPGMAALVAGAVVLVTLFLWQERRASEPVLPLRIVRDPVMRICVAVNFASGLLLWCGIFFVPLFVQEVRGLTPTRAGLTLMPLMFGAALGTLVSGRWVERTGRYRIWPFLGSLVMLAGISLLATLGADTSIALVALFALLLGTGVGFVMQPSLLAAQNSAPTRDLGTATSTALLFRSLGNTIGIPIFGGILNAGLAGRARDAAAFADTLPTIFLAAVPVAVVSVVVATRLPGRPLREEANLAYAAAPSLADG